MYLIPRFIGVGTFSLFLILTYILLNLIKENQRWIILAFYLIILSVISYNFEPASGSDLYRLIPIMNLYSKYNFIELFVVMKSSYTPLTILYFYFIGQFGHNGLLAGITVFIFYSICFYILEDYSKKYKVKRTDVAIVFFFFMARGSYGEVIGGIRTMLAFSIIVLCCYREFYQEKSFLRDIPLYIIASLIHQVALAIVIIRISFLLIQKAKNKNKKVKQVIILILLFFLSISYGFSYIDSMLEKALRYFKDDAYFYIWEYIIGIINLFVILYIMYLAKKNQQCECSRGCSINFLRFMSAIYVIVIISAIFDYNTFHRIEIFISMLNIPLFLSVLNNIKKGPAKGRLKIYVVFISFLLLMLACTRGNLCSLKFFEVM